MNEFLKLMVNTGKGIPTKTYSIADSTQAIRNHFNEIMGLSEDARPRDIKKAFRRHKVECYEIIEEYIDEMLVSGWGDNPFFRQFVEIKNLNDGDKNEFYVPDNSILTVSDISGNHHNLIRQKLGMGHAYSVKTKWIGIKVYEEFERFMAGRIDWAQFTVKLYEAVDRKVNDMLYDAFLGLDTIIPAAYTFSGNLTVEAILTTVEKIQIASGGKEVFIAGPRTAISKITETTKSDWSDQMKNERNTLGGLGIWNGITLMRVPQVFDLNTRDFKYDESKFYILPMTDNKPIKLVYEGESYFNESTDSTSRQDMTIEAEFMTKLGVSTILGVDFAVCTGVTA